ncbi:gasdermin-E-like [Channa argus]|uniref:gasdermin-E-like n=1 Tax=Channa argus TaxID=215402 RepID=UPI003521A822
MFAATAKALVKSLGAQGDLIYNGNANERIEMLTLVKVRQRTFWPIITYSITNQSLLELLEEADVSPEYSVDVLMEDFKILKAVGGRGAAEAKGPYVRLDLGNVQLSMDTMDKVSSITLKKKTVDVDKLRTRCNDKKLNKKILDMLKVRETEKLAFVDQTVYNTIPVNFSGKCKHDGCISVCKMFFKFRVSGVKKQEMSFTVPEESIFAYSLMQITTEDGTLGIMPKIKEVRQYNPGWWSISTDEGKPCQTLQEVAKEIQLKEQLLQPLADLPESTRHDLQETLQELLKDRCALALLEEIWDQGSTGESDCPQSVSSFMELLKTSNTSTSQKDAVHLLISALDTLPDDLPELLTSCSPETLRVLNQLVDRLKGDGQTKLPESLPQGEELRWVVELLCSTNQMLEDLSDQWDRPEFPPGVMLEVLSLVVRGLSLMQPRTDS